MNQLSAVSHQPSAQGNASREAAQDYSPQLALSLPRGRKPWVEAKK